MHDFDHESVRERTLSTVFDIRHGRTTGNLAETFDGWDNSVKLLDEGWDQARTAGRKLVTYARTHEIDLSEIFWAVSDIHRTKQTFTGVVEGMVDAGADAPASDQIEYTAALRERSAGAYTGQHRPTVLAEHPEIRQAFYDPFWAYPDGDEYPGESLFDVHTRVLEYTTPKLLRKKRMGLVFHELGVRSVRAQSLLGTLDTRAFDRKLIPAPNATFGRLLFNRTTMGLRLMDAEI